MAEIERKFVLKEGDEYHATGALAILYSSFDDLVRDVMENGKHIKQGYLTLEVGKVVAQDLRLEVGFKPVEARLRNKAGKYTFTLKGDGALERDELETEIPQEVFERIWSLTEGRRVEKLRLAKPYGGHTLEIDLYSDRSLVVAEVEVGSQEEADRLTPPGKDVTTDSKYKNKNLSK